MARVVLSVVRVSPLPPPGPDYYVVQFVRKCLNNGWTPKTEHVVGITFQHSASDFMVAFDACDNGLTPTLILCSAFHEIP